MTKKLASILAVSLICLSIIAGGCSKTVTTTVNGGVVTLPGGVTTLPAVTVTLAGALTTLPAETITLSGTVTTLPAVTITPQITTITATVITIPPATTTFTNPTLPAGLLLLPTTPGSIPYAMTVNMAGNCLFCHAKGETLEFPTPPLWDGTVANYANYNIYYVVSGSIQDHSGRQNPECLNCHMISG